MVLKYRSEIDGLRALAVVPVILFHAGFELFSGGFVGVDVFFVISGYLITTIILSELEQDKFSILNFYERRARRILPALFLVMLVCIPFAWFSLLLNDMKDFSQSLVAVSLFLSNILFLGESGYFDTAAEVKPLLHTWSLAVEEQYYVLFPLFLMLFWKFGRRWILFTLGLVLFASLALAQWAAYAEPAAAFYLLPTRAWELLIGAFAAFYLLQANRKDFGKVLSELGGWLGVAFIFFSVFAYSKATPFPGLYALLPTLGTLLIILFATQQTNVGKFVGNKVFVGIGLISYSAYLWHQPLFAFARHQGSTEPSQTIFFVLSASSLFLAYFSWKYVESPFRLRNKIPRKYVIYFGLTGSVLFISLGMLGILSNGFESRLNNHQRELLSFNSYDFQETYRLGECFLNAEQPPAEFKKICFSEGGSDSILLWGDSHAAAFAYGLRKKLTNISQYTASGCPPLLGVADSWRPMCEDINKFVSEEIATKKPKTIILHANWLLYDYLKPVVNLVKTLKYIKKWSPNSRIILVGGVPQYEPSLPTYMVNRHIDLLDNAKALSPTYDKISLLDEQIRHVGSEFGALFFSSLDSFCDSDNCLVAERYNGVLMPTAWDDAHLTSAGSVYLATKFKSYYQQD